MKPGDFDRTEGPIESDDGFVYEAWEARKSPKCPRCGSSACVIHNRYTAEIRHRSDILKSEILVCHRIRYCLSLDSGLANAYDCLQGLCRYMRLEDTFTKCLENVRFVAGKLENCGCEVLSKVAATYREWEVEIARGLAKNEFGVVLSNANREAGNDVAQTMIDAAYGYRNFERFRKRFLLMRWNAKR